MVAFLILHVDAASVPCPASRRPNAPAQATRRWYLTALGTEPIRPRWPTSAFAFGPSGPSNSSSSSRRNSSFSSSRRSSSFSRSRSSSSSRSRSSRHSGHQSRCTRATRRRSNSSRPSRRLRSPASIHRPRSSRTRGTLPGPLLTGHTLPTTGDNVHVVNVAVHAAYLRISTLCLPLSSSSLAPPSRYHGDISREQCESKLNNGAPGDFMVRKSTRGNQSFSLSVRAAAGPKHYKIEKQGQAWNLALRSKSRPPPFHAHPATPMI